MPEYVLKVNQVSKSFAGVQALSDVHLEIRPGEIHCLAGENGCGKSTLIKIISGAYTMDSGSVEFNGKEYSEITPIEAISNGIQVIYQDFSIFPNLTVMENLAYNTILAEKAKFVNWKKMSEIAGAAIKKIDFKVDMDALVGDLSVADKQLVAISRALMNNAKLIIMDEPTTALTRNEVNALFKIIMDLKKQGIAILFVSHKLDEVFEICERFTILRNGKNVITCAADELDAKQFSYYMTGRDLDGDAFQPVNLSEAPVFEVKNLCLANGFYDINLSIRKGEILGITGLLGSGRTELALALFGAAKADRGSVFMHGKPIRLNNIREALHNKIAYVPEDRLTEGLFLERSIGDNIVISKLDALTRAASIVNKAHVENEIESWVKNLSIATNDPQNAVNTLSGGNQQRVVLAKWLATNPDLLILNGPTVGVDIGSKFDIHHILRELAAQGIAIIIISDDISEVVQNCNRIMVMKKGRITNEFEAKDTNENDLAKLLNQQAS